jgi:hypothetical protein
MTLKRCAICNQPASPLQTGSHNGHPVCGEHHQYAALALQVRKDIESSVSAEDHTWRACYFWHLLDSEAQYGLSLMVAALMLRTRERAARRGNKSPGMGAVSALELLVALVEAREL